MRLARGIQSPDLSHRLPDGCNDVYNLDPVPAKQFMVDVGRPLKVSSARASGFVLQSNDAPAFRPVSYLDSR